MSTLFTYRDSVTGCYRNVKVKVKFTLDQATKAQRDSMGITVLFL